MKKLFFILLSVLFSAILQSSIYSDSGTHETVVIKGSYQGEGGVERGLFVNVDVTILWDIDQIEVSYDGITSPCIYVVDSYGNIVSCIAIQSSSSIEYIPTPTAKGIYRIVIWSNQYYGEGTFTVK